MATLPIYWYICTIQITKIHYHFLLMSEKRVYTFGNGKAEGKADMRNLLGGKGANLAEMNLIGVPVPPGLQLPQMYVQSIMRKVKRL